MRAFLFRGIISSQRGLTLLQLMVAVVISSLVAVGIHGTFRAGMNAWRTTEAMAELYQEARVVLERMSLEIRSAFICDDGNIKFIGMDRTDGEMSSDALFFVSTVNSYDETESYGDLCEVGYFLYEDPDTGIRGLWRRVQAPPDDDPIYGGTMEELAPWVTQLSFRYFDGSDWVDSWDSSVRRSLPIMVEISILLETPEGDTLGAVTTVYIPNRATPSAQEGAGTQGPLGR
jgi:type II secretion system protein J